MNVFENQYHYLDVAEICFFVVFTLAFWAGMSIHQRKRKEIKGFNCKLINLEIEG